MISAVHTIRKMRGGSQSLLMLGVDHNLWVVKFQNNPQHIRVLANEWIGSRLAQAVGLTVPVTEIVEVSPWLVSNSSNLRYELDHEVWRAYAPGLHFGSHFVGGFIPGCVFDYLPKKQLAEVTNLPEFSGMLCIDKWTGNRDGRQAVFCRSKHDRTYNAHFIDQGFCFGAGDWSFADAPLEGVSNTNQVYANVTGWESFEPWLSRIEELQSETVWKIVREVPAEWSSCHPSELESLTVRLLSRRSRVRDLILSFRGSDRKPFPKWID